MLMTELIYSCYVNKGVSPEGLERKIIKVNTSIYTRVIPLALHANPADWTVADNFCGRVEFNVIQFYGTLFPEFQRESE